MLNKQKDTLEQLYESMIASLKTDNARLQTDLAHLQQEIVALKLQKAKEDKNCGTDSHVTDSGVGTDSTTCVSKSMNTSLSHSSKGTETVDVKMVVKSTVTDEDAEMMAVQQQVAQLENSVAQGDLDRDVLQQQKNGLLDNHKHLSQRLGNVESQLQMTQHKLSTLQAVHELVLNKNECLEREVKDGSGRMSSQSAQTDNLKRQLSVELEKACGESTKLKAEVASVRQQMSEAQTACAAYRQREVEMNTQLTQLTLERSTLQGKVNSLHSDLVNQKAQHVSQNMRVQQLEAAKSSLEAQVAEFKRDSIDLFKKLEEVRQEKDDLSQQLNSLHSQLSESVGDWKRTLAQQETHHDQVGVQATSRQW